MQNFPEFKHYYKLKPFSRKSCKQILKSVLMQVST